MNIAEWDDLHVRRFGHLDGIVAGGRTWRNEQLYEQVCRLANAFLELGLRPGDRVAVSLTNSRELFVAASATWRAGGVLAVLPLHLRSELSPVIRHCDPRILLSSAALDRDALGAAAPILVGAAKSDDGWYRFDDLLDGGAPRSEIVPRSPTDAAQLCYTSGVSGEPRAVILTHGGIDAFRRIQAERNAADAGHRVVLLAAPPTAFGTGFIGVRLTGPFRYVLLDRFEPHRVLEEVERHCVNVLPLVPTMAEQLAAHARSHRYDLSSVCSVALGGSHVSPSLVERLRTLFGIDVPPSAECGNPSRAIYVHYGMTEAGGGLATGMGLVDGVVGPVADGVSLRVVDEEGMELPPGEVGEFVARTPYQGVGYWKDPESTAKTFRDGFIHTGDLGYLTERGEVCLVGRAKEIVIQGGYNVQAREVASVIAAMDDVRECAVIGLPDDLLGEVVAACVVASSGKGLREEDVIAHCRRSIDPRKCPGLVFLLDELPRTHTGKVDVLTLRERVSELREASATSALHDELGSAEPGRRRKLMRELLSRELAQVLRRNGSGGAIDVTATFESAGLDSIGAVQLADALGRGLGKVVSPTMLYSYASVAELADALIAKLFVARDAQDRAASSAGLDDEIAIVGIGCRLPGGVRGPDELWELLERGRDGTSLADERRWPDSAGQWRAGFIENVDQFDAAFFRLSTQASGMDPQHRMFLEVAWEALDDAGCNPLAANAGHTGIFFGIETHRSPSADALGGSPAMSVARLAHFLDVRGPVVSIDSTCSSSLVALHHAVRSLRANECDTAVVGAANVISLTPAEGPPGLLSTAGRSRAFDDGADGFGQGEGCGVVVLKRLADARASGDRVYATILGSAINHDGRSSSLVAPNANAQKEVVLAALRSANVDPSCVQYVEAHGTGTQLGDAIEVEALSAVFPRREDRYVAIGSVKTNIGHLEAAAGVVGLIKAALAVQRRALPKSLHFETPNRTIPWQDIGLRVQSALGGWPAPDEPLVAGVSSFGMSGTNAHVIVAEAPAADVESPAPLAPAAQASKPMLMPVSAKTPDALLQLARRYAEALESGPLAAERPEAIAYTAGCRRTHHEHRLAVQGRTAAEWAGRLRDFAAGGGSVVSGRAPAEQRDLVVVFSGQGSQWQGMGRELLESDPVFRDAIERCAAEIDPLVDWCLIDELRRGEADSRLRETRIAQPALFAVEVALWELWRSWGIEPVAVMGHSLGEVAAAYAAGALPLDRAALLVCERGRIMQSAAEGSMASVAMPASDVAAFAAEHSLDVEVVASNAPSSSTIAGRTQAVSTALEMLRRLGVEHRMLRVGHAFHSSDFDALARELTLALGHLDASDPAIRLVSTVTGQTAPTLDAAYWGTQMRSPVRFLEATRTLLEDGAGLFLEVGPHPVLAPSLAATVESAGVDRNVSVLGSLRRGVPADECMSAAVAHLHCSGYPLDWSRQCRGAERVVTLPSYPWQRRTFRPRSRAPRENRAAPLLDTVLSSASAIGTHHYEMAWAKRPGTVRRRMGSADDVSLAEAVLIELACEAAAQAFGCPVVEIRDLRFDNPPDAHADRVQLVLEKSDDSNGRFRIYFFREDGSAPTPCATGSVAACDDSDSQTVSIQALCDAFGGGAGSRSESARAPDEEGERWAAGGESLMELAAHEADEEPFVVHPDRLAAALRAGLEAAKDREEFVPADFPVRIVRVARLRASRAVGAPAWAWFRPSDGSRAGASEIRLLSATGRVVFEALDVATEPVLSHRHAGMLQKVVWQRSNAAAPEAVSSSSWLVIASRDGRHAELADALRARGADVRTLLLDEPAGNTEGGPSAADGSDEPALARTLAEIAAGAAPVHVAYLIERGADPAAEPSPGVAEICERETLQAFHVLQAIARADWALPPSLSVVTVGAQSVQGAAPSIAQAPICGLVHTLALESPELSVRLIDLAPGGWTAGQLCDELHRSDGEDRVALRGSERFVARLVRYVLGTNGHGSSEESSARPHPLETPIVRPDRSYLITGGFGALGVIAADKLAEAGARFLILVGRRPPSERVVSRIEQWEAQGVRVVVELVDVADENALAETLRGLKQVLPPLAGVVHAAGTIDDGALVNLSRDSVRNVLAAKVRGAWNLHRLTRDLDFFILYSSLASVTGNRGQANYAAANAFLDALAHLRKHQGLPALSINWCGWQGVGMAAGIDTPASLSLTAQEGAEVFEKLVSSPAPQVVVQRTPFAWPAPLYEYQRRQNPAAVLAASEADGSRSARTPSPPQSVDLLDEFLRARIAEISDTKRPRISISSRLSELGIDSLGAIQLRADIATRLGVRVPVAELGNDPTYGELLDRLQEPPQATAASARLPVVHIRPEGREPRIVLVHPVGGGVSCYRSIAAELPYRMSAIESPALQDGAIRFSSIREIARHYLDGLAANGIERPAVLGGWSFGGLVSLEMAACLRERGHAVRLVFMIDSQLSSGDVALDGELRNRHRLRAAGGQGRAADVGLRSLPKPKPDPDTLGEIDVMRSFLVDVVAGSRDRSIDIREIDALTAGAANGDLSTYARRVIDEAGRRGWLGALADSNAESLLGVFRSHLSAIGSYRPSPYPGRVLLIRASSCGTAAEEMLRRSAEDLVVQSLEGDHYSIMHPPAVSELAELISAAMD